MKMRTTWFGKAVLLLGVMLLALAPAVASADGPDGSLQVHLSGPQQASLGDTVTFQARVTDPNGGSVAGKTVTFLSPAAWSDEIKGDMEVGSATTDRSGIATLSYQLRRTGQISIIASVVGADGKEAAKTASSFQVSGQGQLYLPKVGISVWGVGSWIVALVVAVVWALYVTVGTRVLAIARSGQHEPVVTSEGTAATTPTRRRFLTNSLVPLGMLTVATAVGSGLVTIIARGPDTHANLRRYTTRSTYRRTPFSQVDQVTDMREMPDMLEREVSFSTDVLPILRARGGPHAVLPHNSPPPGGVRFDSYEGLMAKDGLVVPGKPEESTLVQVLMDRAMGMPPAGDPLSESDIQVIVSWVGQGAKNG